jgi:hypothetical protein
MDDAEVEDEKVYHVDNNYVNYSCTIEEKEMEIPLPVEQVKEESYEDEDWCLVC